MAIPSYIKLTEDQVSNVQGPLFSDENVFFYLYNTVLKLRVIPQDLGQCNEYCCKQATFGHIYTGDTTKLTTVQTV